MKTNLLSTLACFGLATLGASAQITIESTDFRLPVEPDTAYLQLVGAGNVTIAGGNAATWDFSSLFAGRELDYVLEPVNRTDIPDAMGRIEVPTYIGGGVTLDQFYHYYTKDANSYREVAFEIEKKSFSIGGLTGDMNDSIITIDTLMTFNAPIIEFPLTSNSTWNSAYTARVPFYLTIESAAWYDELITLRQDITATDSCVGYGTVILPSGNQTDVLLVKSDRVRVDSIFMNNSPMDPITASNFGFRQNDTLLITQWSFFAKGMNQVVFQHTTVDGTDGTPYYYRGNGLSVEEGTELSALVVFPNPAKDRVTVIGARGEVAIYDMNGRCVKRTMVESAEATIDVSDLTPGMYVLQNGEASLKISVR